MIEPSSKPQIVRHDDHFSTLLVPIDFDLGHQTLCSKIHNFPKLQKQSIQNNNQFQHFYKNKSNIYQVEEKESRRCFMFMLTLSNSPDICEYLPMNQTYNTGKKT